MASNQDKILAWYREGREENRHQGSRSAAMEFHYTKKYMGNYIDHSCHVVELGCGTGHYGMFFAERCASYTGVDLSPDNIEVFQANIRAAKLSNVSAMTGDATNLPELQDNSFDVVMCLGPMYHLPREERAKVFEECYRIARQGATIAFSYINRLGVYLGACVLNGKYPNAEVNQLVFDHNTGDEATGVFFFTSPEEMKQDAAENGFKVLKNHGLDFYFASSAIDAMPDEQFECYMELADRMSDSVFCTGLSNHALLICRK